MVVLPDPEVKIRRIWGTGELGEEAPRGQAGDLGTTSLLNKAPAETELAAGKTPHPKAKSLLVAPLREAIFTP